MERESTLTKGIAVQNGGGHSGSNWRQGDTLGGCVELQSGRRLGRGGIVAEAMLDLIVFLGHTRTEILGTLADLVGVWFGRLGHVLGALLDLAAQALEEAGEVAVVRVACAIAFGLCAAAEQHQTQKGTADSDGPHVDDLVDFSLEFWTVRYEFCNLTERSTTSAASREFSSAQFSAVRWGG